eukprot:6481127-Prymnesium_polylepis.2
MQLFGLVNTLLSSTESCARRPSLIWRVPLPNMARHPSLIWQVRAPRPRHPALQRRAALYQQRADRVGAAGDEELIGS